MMLLSKRCIVHLDLVATKSGFQDEPMGIRLVPNAITGANAYRLLDGALNFNWYEA